MTRIHILENRGEDNCYFQVCAGNKQQIKKYMADNLVRKDRNSLFFLPKDKVKREKGFVYIIEPIDI